jgi:hypothetical protein
MAPTKQQKMIDSMFCRVDKEEKLLAMSTGSSCPFEGDTIAYSREETTPPPFKRPIGRPQKPMQKTLILEREI